MEKIIKIKLGETMKFLRGMLILSKYLFIFMVVLVIVISSIFIYYSHKLNYEIPEIRNIDIYDENGTLYLTVNHQNKQSYVSIEEIDQKIIDCFISIEDKKFYTHKGIDVIRMGGALFTNLRKKSLSEGASTITQQYARTLFLSSKKTYKRKLEEILIAMNLESKYSKDEILEGYLNTIYFDHGVYGILDACKFYFNKDCKEVTLAEAATLAAIPKGPIYYSPIKNPENNLNRKNLIINELYKDGKINEKERDIALLEKVNLYGKLDKIDNNKAPYYQDMILKELKDLPIDSNLPLKVYTTVDLDFTEYFMKTIEKYYPDDDQLQIAMFAMNPNTGKVISVVGGRNYQLSTFNRATSSKRQPGSTIKPFLYYAALENGFTPATTFYSAKTSFYIDGKEYSPTNYHDIYPNQDVSMAYALATSDNIYAMKTHLFLGTSILYQTLLDFGFTTPIQNNASLALGSSEVHLSELVTGYAKIASLGKDVKPVYIERVEDYHGNVLYEANPVFKERFSKESSYILAETMTNVFDNHLALQMNVTGATIVSMLTHKYAAKSGSTDTDNWMIGFNHDLVLGIWCGYDDNSPIQNTQTRFIKYVWAEMMEHYMKNKGSGWYDTPNTVIPIMLNPISGVKAKGNEYRKNLYFKTDNIPWYIYSIN